MIRTALGLLALGASLPGVALALVLWAGVPSPAPRPCPVSAPVELAHRGDVTRHPPNTLGAVVDGAAAGGAEFDVALLSDDTVVLFHDEGTERLTGEPGLIADHDATSVKALRTVLEIDGRTFAEREPIPTLAEALQAACVAYPDAWVYIDMKTETAPITTGWTTRMFDRTLQTWMDSPCAEATPTLFGLAHPIAALELRRKLDALDRPNAHLEMFAHPGTYPGGEGFWLHTGIPSAMAHPDIFGAHVSVWEAHPDVARRLSDQGYCVAVYGAGRARIEALEAAEVIDFRTLDRPEGHVHKGDNFTPGGVVYTADWTAWWVLLGGALVWTLGLGGVGVFLLRPRR